MNYLTTDIFIHKGKRNNWYNIIGWSSWFISLIILLAMVGEWVKPTILLMVLVAVMLITPFVFLYVLNNFIRLPLKGYLKGKISFASDGLTISERKIMFSDIVEVYLKVDDYYKKHEFRGRGDFRPCLSQGVNNCINLTTNDGNNFTTYFRLLHKQERRMLEPLIEKFVREGKMPLMDGMKLLGIKEYKKIQSFKKHNS